MEDDDDMRLSRSEGDGMMVVAGVERYKDGVVRYMRREI